MRRLNGACSWALLGAVAGVVVMLAPNSARSHHSFAMYDRSKTETLTGRLTRFIPGANHAQMVFELVDADGTPVVGGTGAPVVWGFETGSAAQIAQEGITVESFPEGTFLTVTVHPLRNGKTFGVQSGPIIKCGTELPAGGCTPETGEVFPFDRFN